MKNYFIVATVFLFSITGYAKTRSTEGKKLCFNNIKKCERHLETAYSLTDLNKKIRIYGQCKRVMESGCKVALTSEFDLKYFFTADQKASKSYEVDWSGRVHDNPFFIHARVSVNENSKRQALKSCNELLNTVRTFQTNKLRITGKCKYDPPEVVGDRWWPPYVFGSIKVKIEK